MPRLIVVTNLAALLCLSLLLGGPVDGTPGVVVLSVAFTGVVIMLITEWFTGIRWAPVVALSALVVVSVVGSSTTPMHLVSTVAAYLGWAAIAYWFAVLAFRSRENR